MKINKTLAAMMAAGAVFSAPLWAHNTTTSEQETTHHEAAAVQAQPNIVLIMVDDLGWSDLSSYGGEINTPNIDAIAHEGVSFSQFYTSVSSSPTRSMLMSGVDNHQAGLGNMGELLSDAQRGQPGYEGFLNRDVIALPEALKDNGYRTYMTGKWHLGGAPDQLPVARGFDRSFAMLFGGASHWHDMFGLLSKQQEVARYVRDAQELYELPRDFYSTTAYTDELIQYIEEGREDGGPFFAYLAYTAPHDPLHVPEPWLSEYKGRYDQGYEVLKAARYASAKKLGLIPAGATLPPMHQLVTPWQALDDEQKAIEKKAMEVYAGMVSNVDYNVGRLQHYLKSTGQYDNTIFIFLSDNGANPWFVEDYPGNRGSSYIAQFDNSAANIGHPMSHYGYGIGWASASNGALDLYKMSVGEGGIRVPFMISGPGIEAAGMNDNVGYITDIMPTLLDYAGATKPDTYNGRPVIDFHGKSMKDLLTGKADTLRGADEVLAGEMGGRGKWVRQGDYKAAFAPAPYGDGQWKLFNLARDPGETVDLSADKPEKLEALQEAWAKYADEVGVIE